LFPELGHVDFNALAPDQRNCGSNNSESSDESDVTCPELPEVTTIKGTYCIIFALYFHGALCR